MLFVPPDGATFVYVIVYWTQSPGLTFAEPGVHVDAVAHGWPAASLSVFTSFTKPPTKISSTVTFVFVLSLVDVAVTASPYAEKAVNVVTLAGGV